LRNRGRRNSGLSGSIQGVLGVQGLAPCVVVEHPGRRPIVRPAIVPYDGRCYGDTGGAVARDQRRLAAIVSADVVGYSLLMGRDDSATLAGLKAHRRELIDPTIAEYGGRIVKTTGDGLLLEFSSVVDAVRCAADVQRGMAERNADVPSAKRIELRIGINVGDIILDGEDIFGDGVNVAARLQELAQPGGIVVSNAVVSHARNKVAHGFVALGERQLKNIDEAVAIYNVCLDETGPGATASEQVLVRPAVAILPFRNMSGDPAQEYFADGITEDLITALSAWRWFPVIARNSTSRSRRAPRT
jgi:class 3 adenylate cyclase